MAFAFGAKTRRRLLGLVALLVAMLVGAIVFYCFVQIEHESKRVAPEEAATVAWIAEKKGTFRKVRPNGNVIAVNLMGAAIADGDIQKLCSLSYLVELDLSNTSITDVALHLLTPLQNLEYLDVSQTKVTQKGLADFKGRHPKLRMVGLAGSDD